MYDKEGILKVIEDNLELLTGISFDSKYPGNLKSNIVIYKKILELYPDIGIDKKTFMAFIKLYRNTGCIDDGYCRVCGKLCNCKSDYTFFDSCSIECGRILAGKSISRSYSDKTEDVKQAAINKRRKTNLERYGVVNNLLSDAVIERRKERFNGSISCFNDPNIQKSIQEKNALKHNGQKNPFEWEETKEKIRETSLQKYGTEYVVQSEEVKDKIKNTDIERYGGIGYGSSIIADKIYRTNIEKYGVEHPQVLDSIKEKTSNTICERYGKRSLMQVKEIRDKAITSSLEKYGVEWNCMSEQCRKQSGVISKINLEWKADIEALGYTVELEKSFGRYGFDLYVKELNLLIEVNPTISHQSTREIPTYFGNIQPRDRNYHINKLKIARDNGYDCIMIWDWDDKEKVLNFLSKKEEVRLKDCVIREVDIYEASKFLNKYHLQGSCRGQDIRIGLYNGDELISVMTFGKSRYNSKYEYEWLRYASIKKVHRAVSAMFKYFIEKYRPLSIISYCDRSKFNGKMFKYLGFKLNKTPNASLHYYNIKNKKHFTANQVRAIGACRCLNIPVIDYRETGKDNTSIMIENNYLEIYDCGQSAYIWFKSDI